MAKCECKDPGCPFCGGECQRKGTDHLYRIDQEDREGVLFCVGCATDALAYDVFREATISEKIKHRR